MRNQQQTMQVQDDKISFLSEILKRETQQSHTDIEKNALMKSLFQKDFSRSQYVDLLSRLYGYYMPLEQRMQAYMAANDVLDFEYLNKSALIAKDLVAMGMDPESIDRLPLCTRLADTGSLEELLGCLYVLEGATMGGTVISRYLLKTLGQEIAAGLSFYQCYGDQAHAHWNTVKTEIDSHSFQASSFSDGSGQGDYVDSDRVVASAVLTFDTLNAWLSSFRQSSSNITPIR